MLQLLEASHQRLRTSGKATRATLPSCKPQTCWHKRVIVFELINFSRGPPAIVFNILYHVLPSVTYQRLVTHWVMGRQCNRTSALSLQKPGMHCLHHKKTKSVVCTTNCLQHSPTISHGRPWLPCERRPEHSSEQSEYQVSM